MSGNKEFKRPGGELSNRPLHFFWVVDCSGSMYGEKMGTLNNAINEVIPEMKAEADNNPNAQLFIRTLQFSTGANWITAEPQKIDDYVWEDLEADGVTDMGKAFELLGAQLTVEELGQRALPPVIVLASDGQPTDDYKKGLNALKSKPWYKKAVKVAISIGKDADDDVLAEFTGNREFVLQANNATTLAKWIKWASTVASVVSSPASRTDDTKEEGEGNNVNIDAPLVLNMDDIPDPDDTQGDVW